jgi:hypothetical protein
LVKEMGVHRVQIHNLSGDRQLPYNHDHHGP